MPYITVKVGEDLYKELGLRPNMELVRSNSEGSVKFVPLSDKCVFDDYVSPLLTNPMFGNRTQDSSSSDSTLTGLQLSNDKLCVRTSQNSSSEGGNASDNIVVPFSQANDSPMHLGDEGISTMDERHTSGQRDDPSVHPTAIPAGNNSHYRCFTSVENLEVNDVSCIALNSTGEGAVSPSPVLLKDSSPVCKKFSRRWTSHTRVMYPRKCYNCLSVYKHPSSFARHKKYCEEAKQRIALKSARDSETSQSDLEQIEVNIICEKAGPIFEKREACTYELKECESSNIHSGSKSEAKYIPLKKDSDSCRFFIRKKDSSNS